MAIRLMLLENPCVMAWRWRILVYHYFPMEVIPQVLEDLLKRSGQIGGIDQIGILTGDASHFDVVFRNTVLIEF